MSEIIESEFSEILTPEAVQARLVLKSGKIPPHARRSHPGKGGQQFPYFSHIWGNEQLRAGLKSIWNYAVLDWELFKEDRSVATRTRMWINWPTKDGHILTQEVTCIGFFEDSSEKMPWGAIVASGASRGLCKCMMRLFGIGAEFYDDDQEEMTPKIAWNVLKNFAENQGVAKETLAKAIKEAGIKSEELVNRFEEAYAIAAQLAGKAKVLEEVPEDLE